MTSPYTQFSLEDNIKVMDKRKLKKMNYDTWKLETPPDTELNCCASCGHKQEEELILLMGSFYGVKEGSLVCSVCYDGFDNHYHLTN